MKTKHFPKETGNTVLKDTFLPMKYRYEKPKVVIKNMNWKDVLKVYALIKVNTMNICCFVSEASNK